MRIAALRLAFISFVVVCTAGGCATIASAPAAGAGGVTGPDWRSVLGWPWPDPQLVERWDRWAAAELRDGDLLFLRSDCRVWGGMIDFTHLSTTATDSPFSHVALIAIEDGRAIAYDIALPGPHRRTVGELVAGPQVDFLAVRRPVAEAARAVPPAVAFCRRVVEGSVAYDRYFDPGPDELYCTELVVRAFEAGGVSLCPAVPLEKLPGWGKIHPATIRLARQLTPLTPERPVWAIGNDRYGLWGSEHLRTVLPPTSRREPPVR